MKLHASQCLNQSTDDLVKDDRYTGWADTWPMKMARDKCSVCRLVSSDILHIDNSSV